MNAQAFFHSERGRVCLEQLARGIQSRTPYLAEADWEDMLSDVVEIGVQHWQRYNPAKGSIEAFLSGIASNVLLQHRTARFRVQKALGFYGKDLTVNPGAGVGVEGDAFAMLEQEQAQQQLDACMQRLEDRHRAVLQLSLEGLQGPAIAQMLGINPDNVRQRLMYARRALKALMTQEPTDRRNRTRPQDGS